MSKIVKMLSCNEFNQLKINKFNAVVLTVIVFSAMLAIALALRGHNLNDAFIMIWLLIYNVQNLKVFKKSESDSKK